VSLCKHRAIHTDPQFADLVNNTVPREHLSASGPWPGYLRLRDDDGSFTTPRTALGGIQLSGNAFSPDRNQQHLQRGSNQKPSSPRLHYGKRYATSCGASGDNTCKGLINIFTGITAIQRHSKTRTSTRSDSSTRCGAAFHAGKPAPMLNNLGESAGF